MEEFVNDFCRTIYEIIRIEDEEEGEDSKLAHQISKLLSEEDEAILEEELEDL